MGRGGHTGLSAQWADTLKIHQFVLKIHEFVERFFLEDFENKSPVLINDLQSLPPLKSGHIKFSTQKDVKCSETYEKRIL